MIRLPGGEAMRDAMADLPLDATVIWPIRVPIAFQWGPGLRLIADGLGCRIDEIRERFDRVATDRDLQGGIRHGQVGTCGRALQAIAAIDGRRSDHHRAREPVGA